MKRLVIVMGAAVCAVSVQAMPTKAELTKAQPLVVELMTPSMNAFQNAAAKEKASAAVKVGDVSVEFAKAAETEAARFLLLKGAVSYYARGEAYDKAADAVEKLQSVVKDVPSAVIAEITGKAVGKISESKASRLYAIYRTSRLQTRAEGEVKMLSAKLKKKKTDSDQRRYAEALAVSGNWLSAYEEFAKVGDAKLKSVIEAESTGNIKNSVAGEFWWSYEPVLLGSDEFFKERAATYYRKALAGNEVSGLKKTIVEQRLASLTGGVLEASPKNDGDGEAMPVEDASRNNQESTVEVGGAGAGEIAKENDGGGLTAGSVLSGLQVDESVVLDSVKIPYVVEGQYVVPSGKNY